MIAYRKSFRRRIGAGLLRDESGAAVIEMAILAPALLAMIFGVMQAGFYMQAQNSLRGIAAQISRLTVVQYQANNMLTNSQIEDLSYSMATRPPYMLDANNLDIYVNNAAGNDFAGTRTIKLRIAYEAPNFLGFIGVPKLTLDYSRNIYVPEVAPSGS